MSFKLITQCQNSLFISSLAMLVVLNASFVEGLAHKIVLIDIMVVSNLFRNVLGEGMWMTGL